MIERVSGPHAGGVVTFSGAVRRESRGKRVVRLAYEAYSSRRWPWSRELERIADEAHSKFGADVAILHRVGVLEVGEVAVVIAAAAAHSGARVRSVPLRDYRGAEEAGVPIWKKETIRGMARSWIGLEAVGSRRRSASATAGPELSFAALIFLVGGSGSIFP